MFSKPVLTGEGLATDILHSSAIEWLPWNNLLTTKQSGLSEAKYPSASLSGDDIAKVIPVPIPNTVVKLCEPMIVHTSVKVGIARFLKTLQFRLEGFFLLPSLARVCLAFEGVHWVVDHS